MSRENIPEDTKRAVLVEAGHRCAIPTCKATTTEIHHIVPSASGGNNLFANLIALCPNCHTRFHKKEIDGKAMRMYKENLGILNNRYGEFERRIFEILAKSGERFIVVGAGGDILLHNAIKDGFFELKGSEMFKDIIIDNNGSKKLFPMDFTIWVTDLGVEFIKKYAEGLSIL
ncbi:MAG: HNH endonuclease [bacterium]